MLGLFHDLKEMLGSGCLDWEIVFEFRLKRARHVVLCYCVESLPTPLLFTGIPSTVMAALRTVHVPSGKLPTHKRKTTKARPVD